MKKFYRTVITLCLSLVVLFLITGISSSSDSRGTQSILPVASFSYIVNGNCVYFTDLSVNTDNATWNFGDGSIFYKPDEANNTVSHKYSNGGTYIVKLTAYNSNGYNSISRRVNIVCH